MGKLSMKLIEDTKSRKQTFAKRNKGLKKKTHELSTLCDIEACMISFGMDGEVENWPEDKAKVCQTIKRYMSIPKNQREKHMILDVSSGLIEDQNNSSEVQEDDDDGETFDVVDNHPVSNYYADTEVFDDSLIDKISDNDELAKLESFLCSEHQKIQKRIDLIIKSKNSSRNSTSSSGGGVLFHRHTEKQPLTLSSSKPLQLTGRARDLGCLVAVDQPMWGSVIQSPIEKQSNYLESPPRMPYTWL